jgi:ceramide kinase
LPFVDRVKVREFSFTPDPELLESDTGLDDQNNVQGRNKKTSVWNCDGEILPNPKIIVKVHCQVLPVFARGPD